jgi:hypothetical protein
MISPSRIGGPDTNKRFRLDWGLNGRWIVTDIASWKHIQLLIDFNSTDRSFPRSLRYTFYDEVIWKQSASVGLSLMSCAMGGIMRS